MRSKQRWSETMRLCECLMIFKGDDGESPSWLPVSVLLLLIDESRPAARFTLLAGCVSLPRCFLHPRVLVVARRHHHYHHHRPREQPPGTVLDIYISGQSKHTRPPASQPAATKCKRTNFGIDSISCCFLDHSVSQHLHVHHTSSITTA